MKKYVTLLLVCFFNSSFSHSEKQETMQVTLQNSTTKNSNRQEKYSENSQENYKDTRKKKRLKTENSFIKSCDTPPSPLTCDVQNLPTIFLPQEQKKQFTPLAKEQLSMMLPSIEFTQEGVLQFFNSFNKPDYTQTFLPHSFSHVRQFFEYADQTHQPIEFYDGVLHLFHQKIISCPFVNESALKRMLKNTTPYFEKILPTKQLSLWKEIKKTLWQNFEKKFSFLTENPMSFFEEISDEIIKKVKIHATTPDRLRSTIANFIGTTLDKTVWCPYDQEETWHSFKTIGNQLSLLYEKNIITEENEINLLYWRLIERYCFFLDLTGSVMTPKTYLAIKEDLAKNSINWLKTEEQEEGLTPKIERLAQSIMQAEAKARIKQDGIITDIIPNKTMTS